MKLSEEAIQAIQSEEQVLNDTLTSLKQQLEQSRLKLGRESLKARDLTAQIVAAQQAEDKQLLASDEAVAHALSARKMSDIEVLEQLLDQPYFGRVTVEEQLENGQLKVFEYKIGKSANPDCRIIDWKKAPISKLYYEYKENDEFSEIIQGRERSGKILLRNSVEIKKGRLLGFSCNVGTFRLEMGNWKQIKGAVSARSFGNYQQLPEILGLITAEQFQLITTQSETAMLIQGIAGSGKTSVALHRLAWLLSPGNSELKPNEVLVLVPTITLKNYVKQSLIQLEAPSIKVLMLAEWLEKLAIENLPKAYVDEQGKVRQPQQVISTSLRRVFHSNALLKTIEAHARALLAQEIDYIDKNFAWSELPSGLRSVFEKERNIPTTLVKFNQTMQAAIQRGINAISPGLQIHQTLSQLKNLLAQRLASYSALKLIIDILNRADLILKHDNGHLLDKDLITSACQKLTVDLNNNELDASLFSLLLASSKALGDYDATTSSNQYKHIFVDEVQDLSTSELACIIASVSKPKDLTLAGDIAQNTNDQLEFKNWRDTTKALGLSEDSTNFVTLNVSHRSTRQIMALADHVQDRNLSASGRNGKAPIHFLCGHENKAISTTLRWLELASEKYPNSLSAVICNGAAQARQMLSILTPAFGGAVQLLDGNVLAPAGIMVGYPEQIKGLEFFNVLIFDVSQENYSNSDITRNRLYISITRAEENLCLINWKRPSTLLPDTSKRLMRTIQLVA